MNLCQIYNMAPLYRESIFRLMDQTFDTDFVFGEVENDIKQMDTSSFSGKVSYVKVREWKGLVWQCGIQRLLRKYDALIMTGDLHYLSTWCICIRALLFHPRKKVFLWTHGWYGKESKIERFVKKLFLKLPRGGVLLYGNYAKDLMLKEGFRDEKLFVLHNSLNYQAQLELREKCQISDVYKDHFSNNNPVIISIGRIYKRKKLEMLVDASRLLNARGVYCNFVVVGDGKDREWLMSLCQQNGVENNFWFYGACYDEGMNAELLFNADLCVVPGDLGLTSIHSMMFGTPCITHDDFPHQGPEFEAIVEGKTGSFFKAGNVESLVKCITNWMEEKEGTRDEVRQACYQEIDTNWTPQFQINVLKGIFSKI